jgi:hypothetical protein
MMPLACSAFLFFATFGDESDIPVIHGGRCAVMVNQGMMKYRYVDLRGNIQTFIHSSDGRTREINVLDMLIAEAGAFYVLDRGYPDLNRSFALHQAGAFFVTRAKAGMNAHQVYSMPADRDTGVICDQRIVTRNPAKRWCS